MHNPVLRVIGATACQSPIWAHPPDGGPGCHEPNPAHLAMLDVGRLVPSLARDKNDHFGTGFGRGACPWCGTMEPTYERNIQIATAANTAPGVSLSILRKQED